MALPSRVLRSITDVPGVRVGHYTDTRRATGCTVVLCDPAGAVAGVDVRGAAPGTRETDLLDPQNAVEKVHAVLLAGGSAYGLDAAGGVMKWLEERGVGVRVGKGTIPIVPAAVIFDLWFGDLSVRPDLAAGYAACNAATTEAPTQGSVGVGAGATLGKLYGIARAMKGGVGSAARQVGGISVGAIVAVNAVGDVIDPRTGALIAGARTANGKHLLNSMAAILGGDLPDVAKAGMNTVIGVIATDAVLTKAQAQKVAAMAHDGIARSVNLAHTMGDGDTIFALATGKSNLPGNITMIGAIAAQVMAEAIVSAVQHARSLAEVEVPALSDMQPAATPL